MGSLLSLSNLRQDLNVAFETVDRYLNILENLYYCFRVSQYGHPKIRALKKERKLYLWDWSLCTTDGKKLENLMASQLLKYCHFMEDSQGDYWDLRFLRDSIGHEIDFVVLKNKTPVFAIECKTADNQISPSIKYFAPRVSIPKYFQVHLGKKDFEVPEYRLRVLPLCKFCEVTSMI